MNKNKNNTYYYVLRIIHLYIYEMELLFFRNK